jgi:hypothetical protein
MSEFVIRDRVEPAARLAMSVIDPGCVKTRKIETRRELHSLDRSVSWARSSSGM